MNKESLKQKTAEVCALVEQHKRPDGRTILAIAGAPASGKSTLADSVVKALNAGHEGEVPKAALLPMDGYHLDNRILKAHGLFPRKGAPETFDAVGFCEAVKSLSKSDGLTYFPTFDRSRDIAIAGAIEIAPTTPIIVVEGNYLLLRTAPWNALADAFSASVFVNPGLDELTRRLNKRWLRYGLDPEAAAKRTEMNDLVNARLVLKQSIKADLVLD
ncbi:nucleoside/nucleotide kinase family protein [uncultured Cohaesibacter sp.]|uniref:nucleoside/nucleotide kinase family protein n=1 Tax=uncultured Cohaesibacter sp. TaxID=1002546 RepID=UPI002AABB8ED|nr:nucleoside/nucleotide kinase family protein [uncultured Cohaesibacter sp.]